MNASPIAMLTLMKFAVLEFAVQKIAFVAMMELAV
jgi:hypothetical protein